MKKEFVIFVLAVCIVVGFGVVGAVADVSHSLDEIRGISLDDEGWCKSQGTQIQCGFPDNALPGGFWSSASDGIYYGGGNVGIGTTNPNGKLDVRVKVYGYVQTDESVPSGVSKCSCDSNPAVVDCPYPYRSTTDSIGTKCYDEYISGSDHYWLVYEVSNFIAILIDENGIVNLDNNLYVGRGMAIGTPLSNEHAVDVVSTRGGSWMSGLRVKYVSGTGIGNTEFAAVANRGGGTGNWNAVYAKGDGWARALYTDGPVVMMNGNVGIGTTTPGAKLHLKYSSSGQSPDNVAGLFIENGGTSSGSYVFQVATGIGKVFSIVNNGDVQIKNLENAIGDGRDYVCCNNLGQIFRSAAAC